MKTQPSLLTPHRTLWSLIKDLFVRPKPVPVRVRPGVGAVAMIVMAGLVSGCGEGEYPVPVAGPGGSTTRPATQPSVTRVEKTREQWKAELSPEAFRILFEAGTERPFHNAYHDNHAQGIYVSAATGAPLFSSDDKFESGTGWPSFTRPVSDSAVILRPDPDGSGRAEVLDSSSGGHLGHLFLDGPADKGGKRYCMNSAAMKFVPAK
jgi:methionine-R-sulfoxide reductase